MMPFPLSGAIEDVQRMSWAVRRKPLESFLLPAAAFSLPGGTGALACRDGSLVSLFRLEGARSMVGAQELDGFVELGARRLNGIFTGPGHALHVVFERAPDEAERLVAAAGDRTLRQCERLGLALGDVIAERGRRLAPLMAAESFVIAAWTRPSVLAPDQLNATASGSPDGCATGCRTPKIRNARIWRPKGWRPGTRLTSIRYRPSLPRPGSWPRRSAPMPRPPPCAACLTAPIRPTRIGAR